MCLAYVTHPFFFPTLHLLSALYYLSWSNRGILCRNNLKSFKVKIDYALAIKPLLSLLRFGFMEGVNFLGFSVAVEESIIYCFRGGGGRGLTGELYTKIKSYYFQLKLIRLSF